MKYVKRFGKFDDFEPIDEGFLGLDKVSNYLKRGVKQFTDSIKKRAAMKLIQAIEQERDNPKVREAIYKLKQEYSRLSNEDKQSLSNLSVSDIPSGKIEEGLLLESKNSEVVRQILKWFSLSVTTASFISLIIVIIKGVIVDESFLGQFIGLQLGTLGAILMITFLGSGLLSTTFDETED